MSIGFYGIILTQLITI